LKSFLEGNPWLREKIHFWEFERFEIKAFERTPWVIATQG